jgi:type III pantothenate kinase
VTDLLVDLGNSRLKWAQSGEGRWLPDAVVHRGRDVTALLNQFWSELSVPERVLLVSVAGDAPTRELEVWLQAHWQMVPQRVHAQREQLGVRNSYREPPTLGADRWAALLGARGLTQGACAVVSCGTAVTVDALSADGEFAGGVIVPGLHLWRQSLGRGTAGIGELEGSDASCLARATADAVAAGALFGLAGAIERILDEQQRALQSEFDVFITGGDAALLMTRLARPVIEVPDLVLKGLLRVSEEL